MYRTLVPLVLASASPRRRELLGLAGLDFEIVPSQAAEPPPRPGEAPRCFATRLARLKAVDVAALRPGAAVLGADSIVVVDGRILGKPADPDDAARMLGLLSGRTHEVVTGCCLVLPDATEKVLAVATRVTMSPLSPELIRAYVATSEPLDKAGAYAIQGHAAAFVTTIEGSYTNVVGLPLAEVVEAFWTWGVIAPASVTTF